MHELNQYYVFCSERHPRFRLLLTDSSAEVLINLCFNVLIETGFSMFLSIFAATLSFGVKDLQMRLW